jgi:hypothetical protein
MAAKSNKKNTKTAARADDSRLSANAPLKSAKTCCDCGGRLTKRGEVESVRQVAGGGKARMKCRHKGGCPKA